jgi:hypothetical protein
MTGILPEAYLEVPILLVLALLQLHRAVRVFDVVRLAELF